MKKATAFALIAVSAILLSGCDEKTPSDKLTSSVVRTYAQSDAPGVDIVDWERDNGWVDTSAPNQYIVRYKFNWELTKPMYEVTLAEAQQNLAEYNKQPDVQRGVLAMGMGLAVQSWASDEANRKRYQIMKRDCPSCLQWINAGSDKPDGLRISFFIAAWADVSDKGFADGAPVGAKVPRTAWATFKKTEKGWEKA